MEIVALKRTLLHYVVPVLTLAAAYGIAGRLGLLLAIPPGYATMLWLPSGLALVGVLMGGARMWPGIWLGSFMANIGPAFDGTNAATLLTSAAIPTSIGVGAVVQALVGASLVHRYVGFPSTLTEARKIGALLILGGPVSCLISATVGVTALAIGGLIPWAMYSVHWGTWWVGDTFGVLITTSLVLSWLAEPRAIWRLRRLSVALPLVGALALAVLVFAYTRAQERERLRLLFEHQVEAMAHTIQTRLDDYLGVLYSLESFYASVPEMSGQEIHTFLQRSLARHPGLSTLAWNLRLPGAHREASKESAQRERSSSFQISKQNAPGKLVQPPEEISVAYIEPHVGNNPVLGLDVASILSYSEALQQARDTGLPAVTGRLTLGQEPGRQFGLLVFLPISAPELLDAMVDERDQNLRGYLTGVFRIGDMVEASLLGLERDGIVLRIEDEAAPVDQRMLYDSRGRAAERADLSPDGAPRKKLAGMHWETTVELAGRHWGLHFAPTPAYLAARQSFLPWVALGGGLAFTSLLGAFLLIITGRTIIIEQLMVERTTQLEASKRLEAMAKHRRRTAESLAEVGRLLSQSLHSLEVGQRVVDHVQKLLQARAAALYQLEPTSGKLVVLASRDDFGPAATPWCTLPPGMGAVTLAVHSCQPVVTADILTDPRITLPAAIRAGLEPTPVRAVLALPLMRDGLVIGALSIGDDAGRIFDEEAIELARLFADQASTALANAQLYAEVQAAHERLQGLSRQLLEAQEGERRRIAHELHDEAGQLLVFVHLALEVAVTGLPAQFRECFQPVRDHLDAIEVQLRRLSHELRPTILDDLGLLPALQFLAEGVAARTGLCICVDSAIEGRLAPHVETALYRIMQEGITNITKHAAATHVQLQLRREARMVHGLLQDDGVGFAVDRIMNPGGSRGLGLLGIQERLKALGGTLQITSASGQGTMLQITVPVEPWEASSEADRSEADINSLAPACLGGTGVGNVG
jgi:signal transduction histidine kinase/integral membrane sensor domain MASE1